MSDPAACRGCQGDSDYHSEACPVGQSAERERLYNRVHVLETELTELRAKLAERPIVERDLDAVRAAIDRENEQRIRAVRAEARERALLEALPKCGWNRAGAPCEQPATRSRDGRHGLTCSACAIGGETDLPYARAVRDSLAATEPVEAETPVPVDVGILQASNGYSIVTVGESQDAAWARIEAAGAPWPLLFRATWNNRHSAEHALKAVQERFK